MFRVESQSPTFPCFLAYFVAKHVDWMALPILVGVQVGCSHSEFVPLMGKWGRPGVVSQWRDMFLSVTYVYRRWQEGSKQEWEGE